jgi:pre-mRNA-splicing factor ATP-dependent RNA helicase DHX15/PRP43
MMTKRESADDDSARVKRVKTENGDVKQESNPYLSHWNDDAPVKSEASGLADFKRHATTAKQAQAAEDGPNNPFTGKPLSSKYMSILRGRRDLPVQQQRYDRLPSYTSSLLTPPQRRVPQALPGVADSRLRRRDGFW